MAYQLDTKSSLSLSIYIYIYIYIVTEAKKKKQPLILFKEKIVVDFMLKLNGKEETKVVFF